MDLKDVMTGAAVPNQNLINQTRLTTGEKPEGFWRMAVLDFASILTALWFGYSFFQYVAGGLSHWYLLGAFLLFSAASILQGFVTKGTGRRTLIIVVEAVAIVIPFIFYDGILVVLLAWFIVFLFLLMGYFGTRAELQNQVEVQFFKATRSVEGKLVTGVLLAMIILYIPQAQGSQLFMAQGNFQTVYDWTTGFMSNFYPGIPFGGSFNDFANSLAQTELQNNPAFTALNVTQQAAAVNQTSAAFSATITKATGITPTAADSVSSVLYRYFVAVITGLRNQFQEQFVLAWIIILFVVLRTVGVLVVWAAQLVALVIYEILLSVNFMHIEEATQTKEIVVY